MIAASSVRARGYVAWTLLHERAERRVLCGVRPRRGSSNNARRIRKMITTLTSLSPSSLAWRGIVSVLFAIVALAWPGITLVALTLLFGAYSMADGVFALIVAAQGKTTHR